MANVFIDDSTMSAIGDAIRAKTGGEEKMIPADMPAAIESISAGSDITLLEDMEVLLDLSDGNQLLSVPDGYAVKSAIIEKPETLIPTNIAKGVDIAGVVGTLESGGGEGGELVRYVTFLDEDGTQLFQMPVLVGDTCKDPVDHGDIDAPEKEDTNTIDYTFSGWTSESGGTADSNILTNITADKTVYAAYAANTRYYTVNFYDDDGTTLFKTVEATYGQDLSGYVPEKENYTFVEWNPSVSNITSEFNTVAVWEDYVKNEWDYLAESVAAGTYKTDYAIGYTVPLTYTEGETQTTINMVLVAFDHDDKEDGSGKAAMTFISARTLNLGALATSNYGAWNGSEMQKSCSALLNCFPSNVSGQIKSVKKVYSTYATAVSSYDSVWVPSITEVGFTSDDNEGVRSGQGDHYSEYFTSNAKRVRYQVGNTSSSKPWQTRSRSCTGTLNANQLIVSSSGGISSNTYSSAKSYYAPIGFCI